MATEVVSPLAQGLSLALLCSLFVLLALAVVYDLTTRRIPNTLILGGMIAGLILQTLFRYVLGQEWSGLTSSLTGGSLAFLLFFALYWLGGLGAGDAKLMTAVGALTSWRFVLWASLCTALAGAGIALLFLLVRGGWREAFGGLVRLSRRERRAEVSLPGSERTIPYALAIALGSLWAVFQCVDQGILLPWEVVR